jgi:hypothetical protein
VQQQQARAGVRPYRPRAQQPPPCRQSHREQKVGGQALYYYCRSCHRSRPNLPAACPAAVAPRERLVPRIRQGGCPGQVGAYYKYSNIVGNAVI